MKIKILSLFMVSVFLLSLSCKKTETIGSIPKVTKGIYSLNQGNFGSNNTTLTYYDFASAKATTDYYQNVNGFGLGDTGSDFIIYGGKMYIVMNNSANVTVVNALTAKLIDTISFISGGKNQGPENIVSNGSSVFVSTTDGHVAVIDTNTLKVTKWITVGSNPAQMVVFGNNLYVSNTGGYSAAYDSTLSVIDLGSLTQTLKIRVGINPGAITADDAGNLYVVCTGNYGSVPPSLVKVNTGSNQVIFSADTPVGAIRYYKSALYVTGGYLGQAKVRVLSTSDFSTTKANFVNDGTSIINPYGIDIDPNTGNVYVCDATDYVSAGQIYCFGPGGNKLFSFSTTPTASPIRVQFIQQ